MRKAIIIIFFFISGVTSFAQKNYCEGYIIRLDNDTIHGFVKDNFLFGSYNTPNKISFMDSAGNDKIYLPNDIKGYSKANIANYLSIDIGYSNQFAKIVIDGYVRLLSIKSKSSTTTYDPNNTNTNSMVVETSRDIETFYLYNIHNLTLIEVTQFRFKDSMSYYFSDYPKLNEMILNKQLTYDDLEIIVEMYNKWKKK
jgi:hypothetical protein